ncbi:hypothetical protein ACHQM5_027195 [Ranunculus cassubicifolius]
MGQQQSAQNKDELLYQQVHYGNIEGIKSLFHDGARLEWIDKEGKTPLIAACLNAELYMVAKTLIELGANVNSYRPGIHAGTPLHHAAKRGLEQTVKLLLSNGANASVMNDDCQTPMDVARAKGHSNVVRTLEHHICPFYGTLREFHGPGFLEAFTSQWLSKKVWAVVVPCAPRNPDRPLKLQLAIYPNAQDAQPRAVISLWKAKIEEPKLSHPDPTLIIFDDQTKTRYKFASEDEGDKHQLQWFYNACIGVTQAMNPALPQNNTPPPIPATAPPTTSDDGLGLHEYHGWTGPEAGPSIPSAPPIPDGADIGPVHYPDIDSSPVELPPVQSSKVESGSSSSPTCAICLDAPVEAACIPCGHMAGCMSCLSEIKGKKWGCPVCRAKIEQVVRLYAV